jgi:hypothetical protein
MKIISILDLKVFLEKTDIIQDSLLGTVIDTASAQIQTYLNRKLKKQTLTEVFDAGRKLYFLSAYPVDTLQTLTVTYKGITQTLDSDFFLWPEIGQIEFNNETIRINPREISIAYTGGYTENAISEVIGSDTKNYRCILSHASLADNMPVTGPNYSTYWTEAGSSGVAWASGTNYLNHAVLTGIEEDFRLGVLMQCSFFFRRRNQIGVNSITTPDGSFQMNAPVTLLKEVKDILRTYRRIPGAY